MSGMCGIIDFEGSLVERRVLERMAEAAMHRGPDGIGYHISCAAGIAHLALHETPESPREKQPLVSSDGSLILAADARIDNRRELINALGENVVGEDLTDADLILGAYRRWGEQSPARLIGDFAFVIWDGRRGQLFAARDPMGMRPLYYRPEPRRLLFGTEIKQILAAPGVAVRIFEPAVGAHLATCDTPPEWTFYEGVYQLPASCALTVDKSGSRLKRYWDIDPQFCIEYSDDEDYEEHFLELFLDAVGCRLRGVKPTGIFLSGGLDSASVVSAGGWLLRRYREDHPGLRAYSWAFEELSQCDERHISQIITHHYDIPTTHIPADGAWPLSGYPNTAPDRDDPFAVAFQELTERGLHAASSEGARVMLSGHHGDLMVGLWIFDYLNLLRKGRIWRLAKELRAHKRINNVPLHAAIGIYLLGPIRQSLLPPGKAKPLRDIMRRIRSHPPPWPPWMRREFALRTELPELCNHTPSPDMGSFARDQRYRALFAPMHMGVATWANRLYSRFGLVDSDPWSDRRLVSFALAVPQDAVNRAGENKRILRRAISGIMPEEARRTAGKISPEPLFQRGLKERATGLIRSLLHNSVAADYGYVDKHALADYYEAFLKDNRGEDHRFWNALTLEMWLRKHWN